MVKYTVENGKMGRNKDKEFIHGPQAEDMKVFGMQTNLSKGILIKRRKKSITLVDGTGKDKAMELWCSKMENRTLVSGTKTKEKVRENKFMKMVKRILASGYKTKSMEKAV